jgi:hypothetical protein
LEKYNLIKVRPKEGGNEFRKWNDINPHHDNQTKEKQMREKRSCLKLIGKPQGGENIGRNAHTENGVEMDLRKIHSRVPRRKVMSLDDVHQRQDSSATPLKEFHRGLN